MDLITTNPGIRVEVDRLNRQFRKLCKTPKSGTGQDDEELDETAESSDGERPFGFMYNLFQWAVILGANDGQQVDLDGQTEVPFRWSQVPDGVRHRLLAIALVHLLRDKDAHEEQQKAEKLLSLNSEELSEVLRTTLEELANRGLQLMDIEVTTESPDAYRTVENLVDTIATRTSPVG